MHKLLISGNHRGKGESSQHDLRITYNDFVEEKKSLLAETYPCQLDLVMIFQHKHTHVFSHVHGVRSLKNNSKVCNTLIMRITLFRNVSDS